MVHRGSPCVAASSLKTLSAVNYIQTRFSWLSRTQAILYVPLIVCRGCIYIQSTIMFSDRWTVYIYFHGRFKKLSVE